SGDFEDNRLAFPGRGEELRLSLTEHKYPTRQLPFNEQHRRLRIDRRGLDFVELLQNRQRQIAEKMLFAHRAGSAVVNDIQAVRCMYWGPAAAGIVSACDCSHQIP